jgi:hypothetical protein
MIRGQDGKVYCSDDEQTVAAFAAHERGETVRLRSLSPGKTRLTYIRKGKETLKKPRAKGTA